MNYTYLKKGKLVWIKISDAGIVSVSRGYNLSHIDRDLPDEEVMKVIGMTFDNLKQKYNRSIFSIKDLDLIMKLQGFKRNKFFDRSLYLANAYCYEKLKK